MTIAGGSRAQLAYSAETVWGTTNSTPVFKVLNPTSHSLGLEKEGFQSETIRSDRQINDFRHGARKSSGDIAFEFRKDSLDDMLEAALMGTWATNALKAGTTRRSFTFERYFADIGRYRRSTGCEINGFSLDCPASGIVKGSFSVVGKDDTGAGTAIAGSSYTADPCEIVMDSLSGDITVDGASVAVITSIKFSLENAIENQMVVGQTTKIRGAAGRCNVKGELTAFYSDDTLLDAFDTEAETALVLSLTDGVDTFTFTFPRIKLNGGKPEVGGEREISLTIPFQALYDSSTSSNIKIERT
jgi:hypothetical protein